MYTSTWRKGSGVWSTVPTRWWNFTPIIISFRKSDLGYAKIENKKNQFKLKTPVWSKDWTSEDTPDRYVICRQSGITYFIRIGIAADVKNRVLDRGKNVFLTRGEILPHIWCEIAKLLHGVEPLSDRLAGKRRLFSWLRNCSVESGWRSAKQTSQCRT